ncbi:MAG: V-type ATPase subunit [Clostridiales bacterium]|nr:V-type ATPase subunit [Candidatus Equinaster intestinalis]
MKDTDYAFAVAKVKQLENNLLTKPQTDSLINAVTVDEIMSFLSSKGWNTSSTPDEMLENELSATFETVSELAEDNPAFKVFILGNDFHNLKAAIKTAASGSDPQEYYIRPTSLDLENLYKDISGRNFDNLPDYMKQAAKSAFESLAKYNDGQAVDTVIDRYTLGALMDNAAESGSVLAQKYAEITAAAANIKIAFRGAEALKKYEFFEEALSSGTQLNKEKLARAAAKGSAEVLSVAEEAYPELAQALSAGISELEKVSEELVAQAVADSSFSAFGIDPIIAYYWKKTAEIKNIRIIITCKNMGLGPEKISERVREINV